MTAQPGRPQAPFTSGELAPTLLERKDLKYYRSGAKEMRNVEVLPQGGFRHAGGTTIIGKLRKQLNPIELSGATVAAPNGGTAQNARDGNADNALVTGSLGPGVGPYEVFTITFPAPVSACAVELSNISVSAGSGQIDVHYWNGTSWISVTSVLKAITTTARKRRFALVPGLSAAAALWRVVVWNLTDAATVSLGEFALYRELGVYGDVRLRPFTSKDGAETVHAMMGGHSDVYVGAWQDSYGTSIAFTAVAGLRTFQQLDTMMTFEEDTYPQRILRQGADTEWQCALAPFTKLPNYDYGGTYGNGQPAIWRISIINLPSGADLAALNFTITVNGEESHNFQCPLSGGAGDFNGFAANAQAAILDLPGVSPGVTVAPDGAGSTIYLDVTFAGTDNSGDDWLVSMKCQDGADVACPAYRRVRGVKGGEPIMSDARGYPRCGIFYQQSLLMGGFKSLPNAWMKSETGNYFNFDTNMTAATGAMLVPMDTQGGEAIVEMVAGRSVLLMTSLAEYFLADRAISKSTAPNHVEASRHGARDGVPSAENEGAAIFVHQSGSVLYEFRYDEVAQTFMTRNLSILGSHMLDNVTDTAVRRALPTNDANLLYAVQPNAGLMATFALLREQDVTAAVRRVTDGDFLSAATLQGSNIVHVATERQVNGSAVRYVERLDPNGLLDQATTFTFGSPTSVISGLDDYIGSSVWFVVDDDVIGPYTVPPSATVTLSQAGSVVTVGRWTPPLVETLPPDRSIGPGVVLERKGRIHTVRIALIETTSLAIGANGGKIYDVPLFRFGDAPDVPALQHTFTGTIKVQGLTGFSDRPTVRITQKRPGKLRVAGVTVEAAL